MEIIIKEGKDVESIINEVCNEKNIAINDIYYCYHEKKGGLFNKNSNIEVTAYLKNEVLIYIKNYLDELLSNLGLTVNFETKFRDNCMYIKMYTSNNPAIIGKYGKTLKSLEYLVKQKVKNDLNIKVLINLDVENYREKQEKRLERLAINMAKDVVRTKMPVELDNMNAYDRRIIHNKLSDFKGIKTESVGEEPNRHIVIKPE